jgi:hypothetical protein
MHTSTPYKFNTTASTNLQQISGASETAKIAGLIAQNTAAYDIFIKAYWSRQGEVPVVGTTIPDLTIGIGAPSTTVTPGQQFNSIANPVGRMGQLWIWVTKNAADTDTTATAAGDGIITLLLQI